MLMKVVVENGQKKYIPLTTDAGAGNPCGTVITTLSNTVPSGYLPLGAQFDTTQFPVLYAILGSDTIPIASALGLPTLSAGRYVIKATSGINENQADNVLSALSPVDVVALNNVHSVTSNAVAQKINSLTYVKDLTDTSYTSFLQIPYGVYSISGSIYRNYTDKPTTDIEGRIIFISGAWGETSDEQICLLATASGGHLYLGHCYGGTPRYDWRQII